MAFIFLRLLVLGVIAAAADDVHIKWSASTRASLQCVVPEAHRLQRRPPPPLESDDRPRSRPFLWRRENDELSSKRVSANGTLEVSRKQNGSEGVYQCAVRHQGGLVLGYPVHLKFAYIDKKLSVNTTGLTVKLGQPVALSCNVSSGPPASIDWQKDGEILTESDGYVMLPNQLLIMDWTPEAEGLYRCAATNTLLNKTRTRDVGFLQTDTDDAQELPPIPASFLPMYHEENLLVQPGSRVVLPCPLLGRPKPKLSWRVSRGDHTAMLASTNEILVLESIRPSDEGVYKCAVENSLLTKTFNVTVMQPAVIKYPPDSKEVIRASTVRFNCTAKGNPKPTITWYKDGNILPLGGRYNLRKSPKDSREELVVGGVTSDDAGIYQCFASNGVSVKSAWAVVRVTGEGAAAPTGVQCAPTGPRAVRVRWARPDLWPGGHVVAYTVQTSVADHTLAGDHVASSPGQPHTNTEEEITVPKSLTPYSFQVRVIIQTSSKKSIASDMSDSVVCQGQGAELEMSRVDGQTVEVSWRQFANSNPGVVQWILQYRRNGTAERNVSLDGNITSYVLPATPTDPLEVRVLGSRTLEWLPQNLSLVPWLSTTELDYGKVSVVPEDVRVSGVGAQEFTVSWKCKEASRKRLTYIVCVTNDDGYKKCVDSDQEWVTIDNLEPGMEYEVRVQAREPDHQANRPFSSPVHVTTHSIVSSRFKNLSYKFLNTTTLLVAWSANSPRYTVYYTNKFYTPIEQWNSVETTENSVVIYGIDRTKETIVQVTAYEPTESSKPIVLSATEIRDVQYTYSDSGVVVSWNGTGGHVVRYSQNLTQSVEQWASVNVTDNFVELNDLNSSLMTYVIVVTPGSTHNNHVLTIPPRELESSNSYYLGIGLAVGLCVLCLIILVAICMWRRRKNTRSPNRTRRRNVSPNEGDEEEASEMKSIGGGLVNGGGSKDAGEPLLNGHVHITENPQSKTPNGKMRKGRLYLDTFDLSRCEEQDTTLETVLDADTSASTTYNLLDTSRRPEYDLSRSSHELSGNNSFNKLPDDNMNSELTRSTDLDVDNSKIPPTLQPNG